MDWWVDGELPEKHQLPIYNVVLMKFCLHAAVIVVQNILPPKCIGISFLHLKDFNTWAVSKSLLELDHLKPRYLHQTSQVQCMYSVASKKVQARLCSASVEIRFNIQVEHVMKYYWQDLLEELLCRHSAPV